ncbi:hypothetical protein [Escherichia coli]|uniref:hypothetical protein n=1 Tax=Escherichia coli TaxID=562 RepID=UPI00397F8BF6
MKLLLVQGDLALAEIYSVSLGKRQRMCPAVGALLVNWQEENRVFIEKTKRDELALRKSIAERDCAYTPGGNGVHQPLACKQASAKVLGSRKPSAVWLKS